MNDIKQKLLTNWHLMRIMRLAIGLWLLIAGFQMKDWVSGIFSVFFLYQAVTDTGCCGTQSCAPRQPLTRKNVPDEEIEYEEVK